MNTCIPVFNDAVYELDYHESSTLLSPNVEIRHLTMYDASGTYEKVAKQIESCYIYMDVQYSGNDSDGSKDRPYTNLQDAVDKATCIIAATLYPNRCGYICIVALSPCTITAIPVINYIVINGGYYPHRGRIIIGSEEHSRITIKWARNNSDLVYGFINCDLHFEDTTTSATIVRYMYKCTLRNSRIGGSRGYRTKVRCIACELIDSVVDSSFYDIETPDEDGVLGTVLDCYGSPIHVAAHTVANCNFSDVVCVYDFGIRCITMYNCKIRSTSFYDGITEDAPYFTVEVIECDNCIKADIEVYVVANNLYNREIMSISKIVSDVNINCHVGWFTRSGFRGCVLAVLEDTVVSGLTVKSDVTRFTFDSDENGGSAYAYCDIAKIVSGNTICITECNKGTHGEVDYTIDCQGFE